MDTHGITILYHVSTSMYVDFAQNEIVWVKAGKAGINTCKPIPSRHARLMFSRVLDV